MKVLKIIGGLILVLVLLVGILGLMAPKESVVERSIEINGARDVVWNQVKSLEAQHKWSPWAKRDPNMNYDFQGNEGEVGSRYNWSGNEDVGSGYQIIKAVEPMNKMEQDLVFTGEWESHAVVWINIEDREKMQHVTWGFKTEFDFFSAIYMMLFEDLEAGLGPDYEEGLGYLKDLCEKKMVEAAMAPQESYEVDGITITEKQIEATVYIGKRAVVKFADLQSFKQSSFKAAMQEINDAGFETAGMSSCIYWNWDEEKEEADVAAVIPIQGLEITLPGFESFTVNPSLACQAVVMGGPEKEGAAHEAIEKHMIERGFVSAQGFAIEEYSIDAANASIPSKVKTIITYPVSLSE